MPIETSIANGSRGALAASARAALFSLCVAPPALAQAAEPSGGVAVSGDALLVAAQYRRFVEVQHPAGCGRESRRSR